MHSWLTGGHCRNHSRRPDRVRNSAAAWNGNRGFAEAPLEQWCEAGNATQWRP